MKKIWWSGGAIAALLMAALIFCGAKVVTSDVPVPSCATGCGQECGFDLTTQEGVNAQIESLREQVRRLRWYAKKDRTYSYRLIFVDLLDYRYYTSRAKAEDQLADELELQIESLEKQRETWLKS